MSAKVVGASTHRSWVATVLRLVAGLILATMLVIAGVVGWYHQAFGTRPEAEDLPRIEASPQWAGTKFENPEPLWNNLSPLATIRSIRDKSDFAAPENPEKDIPVVARSRESFSAPPKSGARVTWFGHSSVLIEIDGKRILSDPVWGPTASPIPWAGPKRWYAPPTPLADMPVPDAVVISHDHYDHLDYPTFQVIKSWDTTFFVPLGVAAHLRNWGVPKERIVELDWWEERSIGDLRIVCTPARHASGRGILDQNGTLWAGWALLGPEHRVFFSGDTGLFDAMKRIGQELGPFDIVMVEIGAYNPNWPDWHIGPEQAVKAHEWLRGKLFVPIHWGLFDLAFHGWTEPAERVLAEAASQDIRIAILKPGQSVDASSPPLLKKWWPAIPWQTAEESPQVSGAVDGRPPHED